MGFYLFLSDRYNEIVKSLVTPYFEVLGRG